MSLRRLLAVSHRGAVGGASIVLDDLLGWIAGHAEVEITTLMLTPGDMGTRFARWGEVHELGELDASTGPPGARLFDGGPTFDLVLLNSLESLAVLPRLPAGVPVVSHIHELEVSCRGWLRTVEGDPLRSGPDAWIAASRPVQEMLVGEYGAPAERVFLHPSFVDVGRIEGRSVGDRELAGLRRSLGIPHDAPVVMGSGTFEWRKGPELFVQLAAALEQHLADPVHMVWVGGDLLGMEWDRLRSDIRRAGIERLHVTGDVDEPVPYAQLADVFVLTSHEDPFPLVCLEHAALGHPVVTFRNGGIVDLLAEAGPEAARGVVEHLDTAAMVRRVQDLLYDDQLRGRAGEQLRERVRAAYDLSVAAPPLFARLQGLAASEPGPDASKTPKDLT